MNQENYEFLTRTLENHGLYHPDFFRNLKTKMQLGEQEFDLNGLSTKMGNEKMSFTAKFGKGEARAGGEAFYYLNKIKATLEKENGEKLTAEFSLFKQRGFNTKEMFNLLQGRPVYRKPPGEEGKWAKIDFASTDDDGNLRVRNYYDSTTNFSITREFNKLPVKPMNQQDKEDDILALRSGELVPATIRQDGRTEQGYIGVSPQMGGLTLYNKDMEVIKHTNSQSMEMSVSTNVAQDKENSQAEGQKQNEKLPDTTKDLMKKINEDEKKQGQGQKVRKAS